MTLFFSPGFWHIGKFGGGKKDQPPCRKEPSSSTGIGSEIYGSISKLEFFFVKNKFLGDNFLLVTIVTTVTTITTVTTVE